MTSSIVRLQPCYRHGTHTHTQILNSVAGNNPIFTCEGQQCVIRSGGNAHHQLAGEALLRVAVALSQSGEELGHALVLLQGGVALERLLDQPSQLLRLTRCTQTIIGILAFHCIV